MAYNFNKIAKVYDQLNHIMTLGLDRRWRRVGARTACQSHDIRASQQGIKVLDVACGTGDMAIELLKRGLDVTGIDLSQEMIEIAKKKTASVDNHSSTVNFQLADAEALPFDNGTFNAVTCAFGIRNFIHLEEGLREMARVLRHDGCMVILELATPDSLFLRPFYNFYTRRIIPLLGQKIAGNREAYTYLPNSIEHFPKGDAMLGILERQGLKAIQEKFFFGVCRMYVCKKD